MPGQRTRSLNLLLLFVLWGTSLQGLSFAAESHVDHMEIERAISQSLDRLVNKVHRDPESGVLVEDLILVEITSMGPAPATMPGFTDSAGASVYARLGTPDSRYVVEFIVGPSPKGMFVLSAHMKARER